MKFHWKEPSFHLREIGDSHLRAAKFKYTLEVAPDATAGRKSRLDETQTSATSFFVATKLNSDTKLSKQTRRERAPARERKK